jgi:integrase/recombinase XerD
MSFSCRARLAAHVKRDGTRQVYLQAIMDRLAAQVPLGFCVEAGMLNSHGMVKASHPNASEYNIEILNAKAKANKVASMFRQRGKLLTPSLFKDEFQNPSDELNLISFMRNELTLRNDLAPGTRKHHESVINIFENFQRKLRFGDINQELIRRLKNQLTKNGNTDSTINSKLKLLNQYLIEARKQGHEFTDPFIKIKTFKSNRNSLSESELKKLEDYYDSTDCPENHKRLLQYFIFSCYTGVRISDIGRITWDNIRDNDSMLSYIPQKTKRKNEVVHVPLLDHDRKYLPEFNKNRKPIFKTFSHQAANRYLKDIAGHLDLRKRVTYHTSRHTFGTLMAEGGYVVETQKMMGHEDIKTTMGYVHASTQSLVDAKTAWFNRMKTHSIPVNPTTTD